MRRQENTRPAPKARLEFTCTVHSAGMNIAPFGFEVSFAADEPESAIRNTVMAALSSFKTEALNRVDALIEEAR